MKIKILLGFLATAFLTAAAFSQTVVITPKKTIYTRKFKVSFKEKKTFTITYPIVSGTISAAARKKLEDNISYRSVFETSLNENLRESDWLSEAYYKVGYNKNGILVISLTQEGAGAYPDSQTITKVIDLKTGEQVKFADVFEGDAKFAQLVNGRLALEKKEIIEGIDTDKTNYSSDEDRKNDKEMINNLSFSAENFDEFSVNDKGVTIYYDAGFPHVIQALQPEGRYFFTWAEVKPFIKPASLLAKFVR
ncbi:MAG TPA: hypothetical protein VGC97_15140 [Pyrinomonadaceae bacterium]|jgi:hypothetical protein